MTQPNITLVDTSTMVVVIKDVMSYTLFSDSFAFANWTDWVLDTVNSPNNNQKQNATLYSNYVLKIKCVMAANNACGLVSKEHGAIMISGGIGSTLGAITATTDSSTVESNTVVVNKAAYAAWSASPAVLTSSSSGALANTSVADPFFQFFYCGGSRDYNYTCYKYQPIVSADGLPRFDKDTKDAKAIFYTDTIKE